MREAQSWKGLSGRATPCGGVTDGRDRAHTTSGCPTQRATQASGDGLTERLVESPSAEFGGGTAARDCAPAPPLISPRGAPATGWTNRERDVGRQYEKRT